MKTNVFLAFSLTAFLSVAFIFSLIPSISGAQYYDTQTGARLNTSTSALNSNGGSGASGCVTITSGVSFGSRDSSSNGNVSRLQTYLIFRGYLSSSATGYFGKQTEAAVRSFQIQNSLSAVGNVGPLTRARILSHSCGTIVPPVPPATQAPILNYISPISGTVGSQVYLLIANAGANPQLFFDTGVITLTPSSPPSGYYTFTVPSSIGAYCAPSTACPFFLRQVTPGSYPIKITNTNGTSNTIYFTVTSGTVATTTVTTQAPVISGVDAPTTLRVGELGSWTVHASASDTGSLYYSVLWGDETYAVTSGASAMTTVRSYNPSATFTHVYNAPGVYTPTFTVKNANGQAVVASATVNVSGSSDTTVYPAITSISPTSGPAGTTFTITGRGFSSLSKVFLDGGVNSAVPVASFTDTTLTFVIPANVPASCFDYSAACAVIAIYPLPTYSTVGNHQISIANSNLRISNVAYISITVPPPAVVPPTITSISPTSGAVGSQVTLYGSNFTSTNNTVNFGSGALPALSSSNNSSLTFNVPSSLNLACYYSNPPCLAPSYQVTPGPYAVSVTNANGTSNSVNFTVLATPTSTTTTSTTTPPAGGSSMTLALGQSAQSDVSIIVGGDMYYGLQVTANSIVEDSRCPVGTMCFQAGRVVVNTTLKVNSNFVYNVNLAVGQYYVTPQGFKILVSTISPEKTAGAINNSDYRITYTVSK